MKKYLAILILLFCLFHSILAQTSPTALIRNNLLFSDGTIINDGASKGLASGLTDSIPYTGYLDYLTQLSLGTKDTGTMNIYLVSQQTFKTGPWQGPTFATSSKYFPGVKGLTPAIAVGDGTDSPAKKNAYSHLQVCQSILGSSLWFLYDSEVRIGAYRNLNQLLEPANPTALGFNLYRTASGTAGDIRIGVSYTTDSKSYPPIKIEHADHSSPAKVTIGGLSAAVLPAGGLHVKGDLSITGKIYGKMGEVIFFNRSLGVVMSDSNNAGMTAANITAYRPHNSLYSPTYSADPLNWDEGVTPEGHLITGPIRLNETSPLPTVDYKNTTSKDLEGFLLTEAYCYENKNDIVHMISVIEEISPTSVSTFYRSSWAKYEFSPYAYTQTLVNLAPLKVKSGYSYRFYVKFMKWQYRADNTNDGDYTDTDGWSYASNPFSVTSLKMICYVIPTQN